MKRVYFAGKYKKEDGYMHDYRYGISGGKFLDERNREGFEINNKLIFGGAYYFTGAQFDTHEIVCEDMRLIDDADMFVVVLDERKSTSTIAELMYAINLKKEIVLFCKENSKIKYLPKIDEWFIIHMMQKLEVDYKLHIYNGEMNSERVMYALENGHLKMEEI